MSPTSRPAPSQPPSQPPSEPGPSEPGPSEPGPSDSGPTEPGPFTSLTAADPAEARTLVLLRHAKAESSGERGDLSRHLSARGVADAAAAGTWLAQAGLHADLVVCSPSARTRETWTGALEGGASASEVQHDNRVYEAGPEDLLGVIRETPATVRVLVLVGHAPGVPALAQGLADPGSSDPAALAQAREQYSTAALTRFEYRGDWAELGTHSAALVEFAIARA